MLWGNKMIDELIELTKNIANLFMRIGGLINK